MQAGRSTSASLASMLLDRAWLALTVASLHWLARLPTGIHHDKLILEKLKPHKVEGLRRSFSMLFTVYSMEDSFCFRIKQINKKVNVS